MHTGSDRRNGPWVSLNCPVLSAHLMESELFGHEKGAFTGADGPRTGRFELAEGGSILLDEVTEIDLALQAKLLRVLQERTFERVGSSQTRQVDVRVLATSNRDLLEYVAAGKFREDLYYRLAVVPLVVPPLRDRRQDIPELIDHFLRRSATRLGREPRVLSQSAMDLLVNYTWPGNVRELENIITARERSRDGRSNHRGRTEPLAPLRPGARYRGATGRAVGRVEPGGNGTPADRGHAGAVQRPPGESREGPGNWRSDPLGQVAAVGLRPAGKDVFQGRMNPEVDRQIPPVKIGRFCRTKIAAVRRFPESARSRTGANGRPEYGVSACLEDWSGDGATV